VLWEVIQILESGRSSITNDNTLPVTPETQEQASSNTIQNTEKGKAINKAALPS
jgi:hypothetical protein